MITRSRAVADVAAKRKDVRAAGVGQGSPATTWADIRVPHAPALCLGLAVLAFGLALYLARRFDFFYDEWSVILFVPHYKFSDYFVPHNEHWSTIPFLIYRFWLSTIGLRSLVPYMATLLALHGLVGVQLFMLIRRRAGDLLALSAAALLLFLGRGAENILWPFQMGFVGSVALGLLAMLLLDGNAAGSGRVALASAALVLSLMFSGVGLFFCAAVAVELSLDPDRRAYLLSLTAPILAYGAWYLLFGSQAMSSHRNPFTPAAVRSLTDYLPFGIGAAAAGLMGLSASWSTAALGSLAASVGVRVGQIGRIEPRVAGAAAGVLAQFGLSGLVRGQFGPLQAASQRYVYVAVVFLLLMLAPLVRHLPWRGLWRPALLAFVSAAVILNGLQLRVQAHAKNGQFARQDAELETVAAFRKAPGIDQTALIDPALLPGATVQNYLLLRDQMGSPLPAASIGQLPSLDPGGVDEAMRNIFPLTVTHGTKPRAGGVPCRAVVAEGVPGDFHVPSQGSLWISPNISGQLALSVSYLGPVPGLPTVHVAVQRDEGVTITVPDTGDSIALRVRVQPPANGEALVCGP